MHLVTLIDESDEYKRQALAKIVKDMSGDNADNPDYEVSTWIDDDNNSMFLMSDWGNTRDKVNQWYGVEAVLTPMKKVMKSKIYIYMKGMIIVIGYIFGSNSITVSYDVVNKKFLVEEEYRDRDIGVKMGFSYSVKSREEVRESLNRFKKSFNK